MKNLRIIALLAAGLAFGACQPDLPADLADGLVLHIEGAAAPGAKPAVSVGGGTATGKFLMKAYGNETGSETVNMSLKYYCQKTMQDQMTAV